MLDHLVVSRLDCLESRRAFRPGRTGSIGEGLAIICQDFMAFLCAGARLDFLCALLTLTFLLWRGSSGRLLFAGRLLTLTFLLWRGSSGRLLFAGTLLAARRDAGAIIMLHGLWFHFIFQCQLAIFQCQLDLKLFIFDLK